MQQRRLAIAQRAQHEALAVGAPGAGRGDELQAVEVGVGRRRGELADHLARRGVGQEQVDREQVPLREEDDALAVGRKGGAEVQLAAGALLPHQQRTVESGVLLRLQEARVGAADGVAPLLGEGLLVLSHHALDGADRVARAPALAVERDHHVVAPAAAHVGPERVAEAVGEEARVAELLQCRQLVRLHRVAQPHGGLRVDGADRQVLGQPLHEPQRQPLEAAPAALLAAAPARDVVLEARAPARGRARGSCRRARRPRASRSAA